MTITSVARQIEERKARGAEIAAKPHAVRQLSPILWSVIGSDISKQPYLVTMRGPLALCNCPDFGRRGHEIGTCKHIEAVLASPPADPDGITPQALGRAADRLFDAAYSVRAATAAEAPLAATLYNLDIASAESAPAHIEIGRDYDGRLYVAQRRSGGKFENPYLTETLREMVLRVIEVAA